MTFLSALENYVLKYKPFLDNYDVVTIKKEEGPGMGAILILSNEFMIIRLINDRDQYFIEICKDNYFIDLALLLAFLTLKMENRDIHSLTHEAKTSIWGINYDYTDPLKSLTPIIDNLLIFLNETSVEDLKRMKQEYNKDRGDWLFKKK